MTELKKLLFEIRELANDCKTDWVLGAYAGDDPVCAMRALGDAISARLNEIADKTGPFLR